MIELEKALSKFGIRPGLERIKRLMGTLGNPERGMKVILVTGTNGKGSVTSYLASILREAGYKTGAYYSPHLFRYNERFRINGKQISNVKLEKYGKKILTLLKRKYDVTLFEALTAIAYRYFADEKCDFAVMEIGMGGTYDATNIAEECISIITNVALEHTKYLGNTVMQIARDKAGIMKRGTAITGAGGGALDVIKEEAEKRAVRLRAMGEDFFSKVVYADSRATVFNYIGESFYTGLETGLIGRYQAHNAAVAVAAAEELGIDEPAIRTGLKKAKNPGRLEVAAKRPLIIADGAHNPHAVMELIGNLDLFKYKKLVCVFGCMKDKNWQEMLRLLAPHCDLLVTTQIRSNERAEDYKKLAEFAGSYTSCRVIGVRDIKKAMAYAKRRTGKNDAILVCGSIYLLGEAISAAKG